MKSEQRRDDTNILGGEIGERAGRFRTTGITDVLKSHGITGALRHGVTDKGGQATDIGCDTVFPSLQRTLNESLPRIPLAVWGGNSWSAALAQ